MRCPHCGREAIIRDNVLINVDSFNKSVRARTDCCGRGVIVSQVRSYRIAPYEGREREDEWGRPLNPPSEARRKR